MSNKLTRKLVCGVFVIAALVSAPFAAGGCWKEMECYICVTLMVDTSDGDICTLTRWACKGESPGLANSCLEQ